ncbi:MAG TPA: hypothetical protein VF066_14945 [Thermoleophilaceae bacterium]
MSITRRSRMNGAAGLHAIDMDDASVADVYRRAHAAPKQLATLCVVKFFGDEIADERRGQARRTQPKAVPPRIVARAGAYGEPPASLADERGGRTRHP